ncbi:hypothetical protein ACIBK8_08725 [Streptomyces sp. NPDC050161]|uniref:hypothetical protein n=1 Tax=Streptomyces sp. NPDC050161 TaxID=3365604 RepID=UPI0037AC5ACA
MPHTTPRQKFQSSTVRRSRDIPYETPLDWIHDKRRRHEEGGRAEDALAVLALGQALVKAGQAGQGEALYDALVRGATWREVALALGCRPEAARQMLREWAKDQYSEYEGVQLRFTVEEYRAALALTDLADTERGPTTDATEGTR